MRGGFRGGISNLRLTKDGRTLFFQEGESVFTTPVGAGGGGGGMGAAMAGGGVRGSGASSPVGRGGGEAGGGGGGGARKIAFNVTVRIDKPQEWEEMFDDAWRCMKYRFYDPKLHGTDWDAMRAKYKPLVAYVADRHELMNVINEMIGELRCASILRGLRGQPALDVLALARLVVTVSRLAWDERDVLSEIDINPVFVRAEGEGAVAAFGEAAR